MTAEYAMRIPPPGHTALLIAGPYTTPGERRAFWHGMAFYLKQQHIDDGKDDREFLRLETVHQDGETYHVDYATPADAPVDDVPCPCGAPGAYFIKWEAAP